MQIGYLTNYSEDEVALAAEIGFGTLEIQAGSLPGDEDGLKRVAEVFQKEDVRISAIAAYQYGLIGDPAERITALCGAIDRAKALSVDVVATIPGAIAGADMDENMRVFGESFGKVAECAADAGIRIAMENWPGVNGYPIEFKGLAYSPKMWDQLFEAVPNEALGLEYDPSHLVWQEIDYLAAYEDFADRVYHVHLKDTEIFESDLDYGGIYAPRWFRYRIPGLGEVDWHALYSVMAEADYRGGAAIEHEDPVFSGDRRAEGLAIGFAHLEPIMCQG